MDNVIVIGTYPGWPKKRLVRYGDRYYASMGTAQWQFATCGPAITEGYPVDMSGLADMFELIDNTTDTQATC